MDEKEFNEWIAAAYPPTRPLSGADAFWIKAAWLEATRRADKRARLECAEICKQRALTAKADYQYDDANATARNESAKCCSAIRATIQEDGT